MKGCGCLEGTHGARQPTKISKGLGWKWALNRAAGEWERSAQAGLFSCVSPHLLLPGSWADKPPVSQRRSSMLWDVYCWVREETGVSRVTGLPLRLFPHIWLEGMRLRRSLLSELFLGFWASILSWSGQGWTRRLPVTDCLSSCPCVLLHRVTLAVNRSQGPWCHFYSHQALWSWLGHIITHCCAELS